MIDLDEVRAALSANTLVAGIDQLETGPARIETKFLYPDGASIDLFIVEGSRSCSLPGCA